MTNHKTDVGNHIMAAPPLPHLHCNILMAMKRRTFLALLLSLAVLPAVVLAQAKDPFLGEWELDTDNSTFTPGQPPISRTMKFEMRDGGFFHQTLTPNLFGGSNIIQYTAKFDGKDYDIIGTGLDTISLKRADANSIERTGKESGKVAENCTMKVSPDGKTLTVTTKGTFRGTDYSSVQILKKQ
jgi:hypothetical protein